MDDLIRDLQELMDEWIQALPLLNYEEMEAYVDKREIIISKMKSTPATYLERDKYSESIQQLLQYDSIILSKMKQLRDEALQGSTKISAGRIQRNAYEGSYTPDSVFFDRKK
ncbi:hypothetical protein DVH26_36555 [Paenibacillus sp. H1-7]|uniref:hypothetical protein n=1 Tax=Paenibacillus sp. H1-7 TaxID=2282849 RepID=UPI001EF8AB65|nr:hypothetical protein [Paenibacillus sp. H1-7]ULL19439.1 hypothetical protein DVH26_36555 [Paenibacillus sp. H1-7]